MREMSVAEQRYKAVLAVIADGHTVTEVARDWGVSRQTMHGWLARYEAEGLEGLSNRSHRPALGFAQYISVLCSRDNYARIEELLGPNRTWTASRLRPL